MSWWSKHVTHSSTFRKIVAAVCMVVAIIALVVCCVFGFAWAGVGIFQAVASSMASFVGVSVAAVGTATAVSFKAVFLVSLLVLVVATVLGAYSDAYAEKYSMHQQMVIRSTSVPWKTSSSFAGSRVVSVLRHLQIRQRSARRVNRPPTTGAQALLAASIFV